MMPREKHSRPVKQRVTLLSVVIAVVGLWGVVLPRLANIPGMQEKIQHLEQKGIDPNAFFYTDHPSTFGALADDQ